MATQPLTKMTPDHVRAGLARIVTTNGQISFEWVARKPRGDQLRLPMPLRGKW